MLGTRGCRLGLQWPEIYEMQVRAIVRAALAVRERTGEAPRVEIMHPLVGVRRGAAPAARAHGPNVATAEGCDLPVPRRNDDRAAAGLRARRRDRRSRRLLLVRHQRPDPDRARLLARRRRGQVPHPLPRGRRPRARPVRDARPGRRRRADADRRRARPGDRTPGCTIGICGEHGGDPASVALLPRARPRLRLLLAVPRAGRPARGGAGGAGRERRGQLRGRRAASDARDRARRPARCGAGVAGEAAAARVRRPGRAREVRHAARPREPRHGLGPRIGLRVVVVPARRKPARPTRSPTSPAGRAAPRASRRRS